MDTNTEHKIVNEKLHISEVMYSMKNNDKIIGIIDIGIMRNLQKILTYRNGSFYDDDGKEIPTSMIYDFEYYT